MADSVTCDQCGRSDLRRCARGWRAVRKLDTVEISAFNATVRLDLAVGDFCSTDCLVAAVEAQSARDAEAKKRFAAMVGL